MNNLQEIAASLEHCCLECAEYFSDALRAPSGKLGAEYAEYVSRDRVPKSKRGDIDKRFAHSLCAVQGKGILIAGNDAAAMERVAENCALSGVGRIGLCSSAVLPDGRSAARTVAERLSGSTPFSGVFAALPSKKPPERMIRSYDFLVAVGPLPRSSLRAAAYCGKPAVVLKGREGEGTVYLLFPESLEARRRCFRDERAPCEGSVFLADIASELALQVLIRGNPLLGGLLFRVGAGGIRRIRL